MKNSELLEVWLHADFIGEPRMIGILAHDRGQVRFRYDQDWLGHAAKFSIDPDLVLDAAPFFPKADVGNFGIFLDSAPDRWGQMLMKRREALEAKDERRPARNLYAWDYLVGVQDETRVGALRFKRPGGQFLSQSPRSAPPITSLRELESIARAVTERRIHDLTLLRKWLTVLVAPGASLGGARPKASFRDTDGSLWIAKFPAANDDYDQGAWEGVIHELAQRAGVVVPSAKVLRLTGDHHTFCVQRFDRSSTDRIFYASAMTLLRKEQSEGTSYLEIAEFLQNHGGRATVSGDLAQLFRRVIFNVAVSNRDDHLRNHGFLLDAHGWRLSPAFDVNPNIDKADHVLNLDQSDNRPSMATVLATADWYGLSRTDACALSQDVLGAVSHWRDVAGKFGLSQSEIDLMEPAFIQSPDAVDQDECGM